LVFVQTRIAVPRPILCRHVVSKPCVRIIQVRMR